MWVTASRAIDLQHFHATPVDQLWKIEMHCRPDPNDPLALIAPKSDRQATRRIVKWIPAHPAVYPIADRWPSWSDIDIFTKRLNTTPHAIRRTAIQHLESCGFSTTQIACLSGHAIASNRTVAGVSSYLAQSPADRGAQLSVLLSRTLFEAIGL